MENNAILKEIEGLKKIKTSWTTKRIDKIVANDLIIEIKHFLSSFKHNFPHASKYYHYQSMSGINFYDGLNDLEHYSESKLKKKDDYYFNKGKDNIINGLEDLIYNLENEL
jgi:hypothetical protein